MSNDTADVIVAASTVHTMAVDAAPVAVLAIRDGRIAATAGPDDRRDLIAAWRGPDTVVIDDPGLVVLPAFVDTHNHLMLAAQNILGVPVSRATDIPGLVRLIRERASRTPAGQWIRTAADWHELRLAERRLPTAAELDEATTDHPVLLQRGGHNGVLNSAGLRLAGIGRDTPDLEGGFIDRDAAGEPLGWVQDAALELAQQALPPLPEQALISGLAQASAATRRTGSPPCGRRRHAGPVARLRPRAGRRAAVRPLPRHDDDHAGRHRGRPVGGRLPRRPGGAGDQAGRGRGPAAGLGPEVRPRRWRGSGGDDASLRRPARLPRRADVGQGRPGDRAGRVRAARMAGRHPRHGRPSGRHATRRHRRRPRAGRPRACRDVRGRARRPHRRPHRPRRRPRRPRHGPAGAARRAGARLPRRLGPGPDRGVVPVAGTGRRRRLDQRGHRPPDRAAEPAARDPRHDHPRHPGRRARPGHAIGREEALRLYTVAGARFLGGGPPAPSSPARRPTWSPTGPTRSPAPTSSCRTSPPPRP